MISGNIQSVFWATGNKLKVGEYYTETASHFMDLIRGVADVTPILMDARKVRELVSDILDTPQETESTPLEVPENIISQESANDPINEVKTIADLPEHYQTNPNLALFMKGFETDLAFTKQDHNGRLSIKTQYRIMRATEIWGPIGVGWGYDVKREWVVDGAPIIMNGAITEHYEQVHKCEITFGTCTMISVSSSLNTATLASSTCLNMASLFMTMRLRKITLRRTRQGNVNDWYLCRYLPRHL